MASPLKPETKVMTATTASSVQMVAANARRTAIYVHNEGSNIVRIGDSTVTLAATPATAGYGIEAGGEHVIASGGESQDAAWEYYVQAETADTTISVKEIFD